MTIRIEDEYGHDTLIVKCECRSTEHVLWFTDLTEENEEWPEVLVEVHLTPHYNVFRRIWTAIKYIFGYRSKYGDFDEVLMDYDSVKELQKFCTAFLLKHYKKGKTLS